MVEQLKRNIFQRILGICATPKPADEGCWTYADGRIEIDLTRAAELSKPWGAVRLEKKGLPERVLVVRDEGGTYHAFRNRCTHVGRRLDPVRQTKTVQCCSVSKSTFGYDGHAVAGPVSRPVTVYEVLQEKGKLTIAL